MADQWKGFPQNFEYWLGIIQILPILMTELGILISNKVFGIFDKVRNTNFSAVWGSCKTFGKINVVLIGILLYSCKRTAWRNITKV